MIRRTLSLLAVLALATPAAAQQTELSVQTIYGSSEFGTQLVSINWTDDGKSYTTVEQMKASPTSIAWTPGRASASCC